MFQLEKLMIRRLGTTVIARQNINNVVVIGSGLMGSGIAQVTAQANIPVVLVDQSQSILDKAHNGIEASLKRIAKKKFESDPEQQSKLVESVMKNISTSVKLDEAVAKANLVIEAIVENVEIKQKLFAQVEDTVASDTILTTNTSSLRLADIGKNLKRKENFGGLHFFNPVPLMKLLEVVRGAETSDETMDKLLLYGKTIGKVTVLCKDTPGFIVNRLLVPYMFEAMRMYERGDASKEDIDKAMKLGAGYPMGPFELADYVGLDTSQFIQKGWETNYPSEPLFRSSELLDKLVGEGKFGAKTGEGFYKHQKK
jgi:3-hydroxyacyl-CoA dehydrogenase